MIAAIIGTAAVLAFMVITYGRFGVYANFALTLNLFLILGVMAIFNAHFDLAGNCRLYSDGRFCG